MGARPPAVGAGLAGAVRAGRWGAILAHDIPGLRLRRGTPSEPDGPARAVRESLVELLRAGQGVVATHHAVAGWPGWEGWAEALGGRFHYAPGRLRGRDWPSSGTRITTYTARVVAPDHPVCTGVDAFGLTDELYCCPVFEDDVVPLLRTDAPMDGALFISTYEHVLVGEADAPDCRVTRRRAISSAGRRSPNVVPSSTCSPGTRPRCLGSSSTAGCSPTRWLGLHRPTRTAGPRRIPGGFQSAGRTEALSRLVRQP